jgi:hypothetical protein
VTADHHRALPSLGDERLAADEKRSAPRGEQGSPTSDPATAAADRAAGEIRGTGVSWSGLAFVAS